MDKMLSVIVELICFLLLFVHSNADTPANCTYEEVAGRWIFFVGEGEKDRTVNCLSFGKILLYD